MIRIILLFFSVSILIACKSVQQSNEQLYQLIQPGQLQSDVDYVHQKLTKYHPQLYRFISKEALDYKFDSVKASITRPMSATDFYVRLSPVVASIRQGHATLSVPYLVSKEEEISSSKLGYRPGFPFVSELIGDRFFILKDIRKTPEVPAGTEILSMNGCSPMEIFNKYRDCISRDGYIETFRPKKFTTILYYYFKEQKDRTSVDYKFRFKDSVWTRTINYAIQKSKVSVALPDTVRLAEPKSKKAPIEKDNTEVLISRSKAKMFRFYSGDSSIAVMRIENFRKDAYKEFYQKSFDRMQAAGSKVLIIDLRDNPGGFAKDAATLYSYLVDSSFQFNKKLELTSRKSLLANYRFMNTVKYPLTKPFIAGLATVAAVPQSLAIKKVGEGRYMYPETSSKIMKAKSNGFGGKVYVLINGATFSAASLLSANLKGSGRAIFVGTETGGAQNGCVAGLLPVLTLPYSKLSLRFGLAAVEPYYATGIEGRGIFPDIEVVPTLEDRLKGRDPELKQVIKDVKRK